MLAALRPFFMFFALISLLPMCVGDTIRIVFLTSTSGSWGLGGLTAMEAVRMMSKYINENPALLPDHTLEVLVTKDEECYWPLEEKRILDMIFEGQTDILNFTHPPYEFTTIPQYPLHKYVGFVGPRCSSAVEGLVNILWRARKPFVSPSATSPSLSDHDQYPYFWRTIAPDQPELLAQAAKELGFEKVAVFASYFEESWLPHMARSLRSMGVQTVGRDLGHHVPGADCKGFFLAEQHQDQANALANDFIRKPARVAIMLASDVNLWYMLCALDRSGVRGLILMYLEWARPAPIGDEDAHQLVSAGCTLEQLHSLSTDSISLSSELPRMDGVNAHGCIPWMDPHTFEEQFLARTTAGDFHMYGPTSADALCMWALALHNMLYTRGYTVADLESMNMSTFEMFQHEWAATDFQGVHGRVRFRNQGFELPGPDPETWKSLKQNQDPSTGVSRLVALTIAGGESQWIAEPLEFRYYNERLLPQGGKVVGTLQEFATCATGKVLDFPTNLCKGCPIGWKFCEESGTCQQCGEGFRGVLEDGVPTCEVCTAGYYQPLRGNATCLHAPVGYFVPTPQAVEAIPCDPGTYASNSGSTACSPCPIGQYASLPSSSACSLCGPGRTTVALESSNASSCVCKANFYSKPGMEACTPCGFLVKIQGVVKARSDACRASDEMRVMFVLGIVAATLVPCLVYAVWKKIHGQLQEFRQAQEGELQAKVREGMSTITRLRHPMILISAPRFLSLDEEELHGMHERCRDAGILTLLDARRDIESFHNKGNSIIFLSYQRLSWSKPGPNSTQFDTMRWAVRCFCQRSGLDLDTVFVWLDILSIPQKHDGTKKLAVYSLYTYASMADSLIVVAPRSTHAETGEPADLSTYKRRVWTRVEQLAHLSSHSLDTVHVATENSLEPVDGDWINSICCVFDGDMTCCRLKHKGRQFCDRETLVAPLLGLWFKIYTGSPKISVDPQQLSGPQDLLTIISNHKLRAFPKTFDFVTEHGVEERPLFGDLIARLERYIERSGELQVSSFMRGTSWSQDVDSAAASTQLDGTSVGTEHTSSSTLNSE